MSLNWQQVWNPGVEGSIDPFSSYLEEVPPEYDPNDDMLSRLQKGVFCTASNLDSSLKYINYVLSSLGYPSPIALQNPTEGDVVATVNTLYALLEHRQRDIESREEVADKFRRLQYDKDQLQSQQRRIEERAQVAERDVASLQAKDRAKEEQMRKFKDKWESEKEELSKQLLALQHRDSQYIHEVRKKEREYARLQEKLQHMLNERNREVKAVQEILQTIQREGRKRGNWKTGATSKPSSDEEMHDLIISAYEREQQKLITENTDLRNTIRDLQGDLQNLMNNAPKSGTAVGLSNAAPLSQDMLAQVLSIDQPFSREKVRDYFKTQIQKYRDHMSQLAALPVSDIKKTLEESKKVIEEQDKLIQYSLLLDHGGGAGNDTYPAGEIEVDLDDSRVVLAHRLLDEERQLFAQQKMHFDTERAKLTEASIQLAKERLEVQYLKKQLELETLGGTGPALTDDFVLEERDTLLHENFDNLMLSPIPKKQY